jgi:tetratricopeptide (TPR) repeat protein
VHKVDSDIQVNKKILLVLLIFCASAMLYSQKASDSKYDGLIIKASELYQMKNYAKSEKALIKIIKKYPAKSASYYLLSKINEEKNNHLLYMKYAEKAYIRDTSNKEYLNNLINAYHINNNNVLLKKYLLKAIPNRKEIDYKILLALTDFTGFDEDETINQLNNLEIQNPDNEQVKIIKYQIFSYLQKHDSAKNEILKLISANPDEIQYRVSFINTLKALKDTDGYLQQIEIIDSLDKSLDNTWIITADYLVSKNNPDQINKYFKSIINNDKVDTLRKFQIIGAISSKINSSKIYDDEIMNWINKSNYSKKYLKYLILYNYFNAIDKSENAFNYLVKYAIVVKTDYSAWTNILQYYYNKLNYEKCLSYCDTAELFHNDFLANYYRILVYYQLKEYKKLNKIVKSTNIDKYASDDFNVFLFNLLALSYYESNNLKKSFKYYEKIIRIDTADMIALNNYAYFLSLEKKNLNKAEMMSRKTVEKEPNNSTYLDTYAWILFKMKSYDDALYYVEEAVKYNGITNGEIMDHYGDILRKKERLNQAIAAWEISQKLEPDPRKQEKLNKYKNIK